MSYGSLGTTVSAQTEGQMADYAAILGPNPAPKPLSQITKQSEVAAYAAAGYTVSGKNGWDRATEMYFDVFVAARHGGFIDNMKSQLRAADKRADAYRAAASNTVVTPTPETELPTHIRSAGFMGGMPWWALVGAGAAVYFMVKKGKKSPAKRKAGPRRKRPSRSSKRPRSLQRRRRRSR